MKNFFSVTSVALCESLQPVLITQCVVRDALDAISQPSLAEVEQKPDGHSGKSEVGQQLFGVNGMQHFRGFQFHKDEIVDQQIDAKFLRQRFTIPRDWERLLPLNGQTTLRKFSGENGFIRAFQKSRPNFCVNLASRVNDYGCDFVDGNGRFHSVDFKQQKIAEQGYSHGATEVTELKKNSASVTSVALCAKPEFL